MFRIIFGLFRDISVFLYRLTGGKIGGHMQGLSVLLLRTTGRKTRKERITPLGYFTQDGDYVITASNAGSGKNPGWFLNLRANPRVTIEVNDRQVEAQAEVATAEKRSALWSRLISLSPAYANYARKTTRQIPLVILHPLKNG